MYGGAVEESDGVFYDFFKSIRFIYMFRPVKCTVHKWSVIF